MRAQQVLALWRPPPLRLDNFYLPDPCAPYALAHATVTALVDGEERGPAYVWGEAGSGKTHLLQGAFQAATERGAAAMYLPLRELAAPDPEVFAGLEACALVCVDDVQAIVGREELELALFALYDHMRLKGRALLLSGAVTPAELGLKRPELASRLAGALCCHTEVPADTAKLAILAARATALGLELPETVGHYLITRHARDLGNLVGILEYLDRAALAAQRRLTVPFVRSMLEAGI